VEILPTIKHLKKGPDQPFFLKNSLSKNELSPD
jgi:hypothetical protein